MRYNKNVIFGGFMVFFVVVVLIYVVVFFSQVVCLGNDLIFFGFFKEGNEVGIILVWDGGIIQIFFSYEGSGDFYFNLFLDDEVLFIINVSNVEQYFEYLIDGLMKMFDIYLIIFWILVYKIC